MDEFSDDSTSFSTAPTVNQCLPLSSHYFFRAIPANMLPLRAVILAALTLTSFATGELSTKTWEEGAPSDAAPQPCLIAAICRTRIITFEESRQIWQGEECTTTCSRAIQIQIGQRHWQELHRRVVSRSRSMLCRVAFCIATKAGRKL